MNTATTTRTATARQLHYLRVLAEQTGTTFTSPRTSGEASREISRLAKLRATRGRPVELADEEEDDRVAASGREPRRGDPLVRSSDPASQNGPRPIASPAAIIGQRRELARYVAGGEERVVYAQRIDGTVRLTDCPAAGGARAYLIERGVEEDGYAALQTLVCDYIGHADELDAVPMATSGIRREIERLAHERR